MSMDHITAAEDRPVRVCRRGDLQVHESVYQGETSWVIKDPVALKYHRLKSPEMIVWRMLDGNVSLREIQTKLHHEFPTKKTRLSDLQWLLANLHKSGLVIADNLGQGSQMLHRRRETRRREWKQRLSNILAIRFPGFDPEPILRVLHPKTKWIFSRWFMTLWLVLLVAASLQILTHMDEFQERLPGFHQFFTFRNFLWMALLSSVIKIIHEFGHGLACKHYDGECHEIGVMLLVLTPTLYCDTSDSWILPNKWHRAFIGAAGMYMEILMASVATFVWWYTMPGLLNYAALNVIFVCSVSTVVFNANPLLRYDGYYILSDIIEIPNLAQKSRAALMNLLRTKCLGLKPIPKRQLPQRGLLWFGLYSVASFLYRWFVLLMIMWFLYKFFEPYGLEVIGHTIIASSVFGLVGVPMWQLFKFFRVPGRINEVKPARFFATLTLVGLIVAAILFVPFPSHVYCPLVIRPDGGENIYVTQPGRVTEINVDYGTAVDPGTTLAQLESKELEVEVVQLNGELVRQQNHLRGLEARRSFDSEVDGQIPSTTSMIEGLQKQIEQREVDRQQLQLKSSIGGILMPPAERPLVDLVEKNQVLQWSRLPLGKENSGAFLEVNTHIGTVGDPTKMKALLLIEQRDIGLIAVGHSVTMMLDEAPGTRLHGEVRELSQTELREPPRELTAMAGGEIATEQDESGVERPLFTYYQATVPLHNSELPLMSGFRGRAKIAIQNESIASKVIRVVRNLIHFR